MVSTGPKVFLGIIESEGGLGPGVVALIKAMQQAVARFDVKVEVRRQA